MVKPKPRPGTVIFSADGDGVLSHAGTVLLAETADRTGLTAALSEALSVTRQRASSHDPGRVLRDVAVMLADGGDCVSDIQQLAGQQSLLGV